MTMLDRMRRHKNWLKWSLALVCLAFIVFYIPSFLDLGGSGAAAPTDQVASVNGDAITVAEFSKTYQAQLRSYRTAYGGKIDDRILKQLGIDQQILQQLIDERAALSEARRLNLTASDQEVQERIASNPTFQQGGRFIGSDQYEQLLRANGISPAEFEDSVRSQILLDKLRGALTDWMTVPDAEVEQEFRRQNEKVKFSYVVVSTDKFRPGVTATDAEVSAYFDARKETYRVPEKRRARYVLVDVEALRSRQIVPQQDIERYYNENIDQYSTPEQIRASHILFKIEGKNEADVRKTAEGVLARARAGEDFAELAKTYSEDEASAKQGGDLAFFTRGRMVPEFEDVAFRLEPGQISDLVKTQFGFHIIKLTEKRAATTKSLAEVHQQIQDQLAAERAQVAGNDTANRLGDAIKTASDLDKGATREGLKVQETGSFAKSEPVPGLGPAPEAAAAVFALRENEATPVLRVPRGFAIFAQSGRQASYLPALAEVRDRVRQDVLAQKATSAARAKAAEIATALKGASDFAKGAKDAGLEAKTTDLQAREHPLPDVGASPALDRAAFALKPGETSGPLDTGSGFVVLRVVERQDAKPEDLARQRETVRSTLLSEHRSRFFNSYMTKAKEGMKIVVYRETLQRATT